MNANYGFGGDEVHEESSWRYTIGIFLATLILCAIFLFLYIAPSYDDLSGNVPSPTVSEEKVRLSIRGHPFELPASYTIYPRERRGGSLGKMHLYALWPTFSGYVPSWKPDFVDNEPDSRRIDMTIVPRVSSFTETDRINALYLPHTIDQRGTRTPYGLNRYVFKKQRETVPTNGYANSTLFIGEAMDGNTVALFCYNEDVPTITSPECWRELEINADLAVIYRFKRPYLAEWRDIDQKVREFIRNAMTSSQP